MGFSRVAKSKANSREWENAIRLEFSYRIYRGIDKETVKLEINDARRYYEDMRSEFHRESEYKHAVESLECLEIRFDEFWKEANQFMSF